MSGRWTICPTETPKGSCMTCDVRSGVLGVNKSAHSCRLKVLLTFPMKTPRCSSNDHLVRKNGARAGRLKKSCFTCFSNVAAEETLLARGTPSWVTLHKKIIMDYSYVGLTNLANTPLAVFLTAQTLYNNNNKLYLYTSFHNKVRKCSQDKNR